MIATTPLQTVISILNWNRTERTRLCLESLREAGYLENPAYEVVVTDNGSKEEEARQMEQVAAEMGVQFRRNTQNLGFAGGHNIVIQEVIERKIDFIWLLNNDCVVDPGTLEALEEHLEQEPKCAAVSPCLAYEDTRRIYFAGAVQNWAALGPTWCPPPWDEEFHRLNRDRIWALGTALLLRSSALSEAGALNEDLFAYYEDDDLAQRLMEHNWHSAVLKDIVIYHNLEAEESQRRPPYFYYLMARNWYWFYLRYVPQGQRKLIKLRLAATLSERAGMLREAGYKERCDALLLGLHDALQGRMGPPDLDRTVPVGTRLADYVLRIINGAHRIMMRTSTGNAG